ncbi:hypothetical protein BDR07DRAFT_1373969 [Suillus spraguei]|nr:hypothetical protein BDR07DRAFT_1373969 [Suillus spraguei]
MIHKFLASFKAPLWAGKLPLHVGKPAGGSLTADEYKFAVITVGPSSFQLFGKPSSMSRTKTLSLQGTWKMYGKESMKPNFHWSVHLAQQIKDYGPVYNFWVFLSEQLNKVLKSSNSNNWTGGQVEISMMREFMRAAQIDSMARGALQLTQSLIIDDGQEALQDATNDMEPELDELRTYLWVQPGPASIKPQQLSHNVCVALFTQYNSTKPLSVHYALDPNLHPGLSQLQEFALLDG